MATGGINIDCSLGVPPRVGDRFTVAMPGPGEVDFVVTMVAAYPRPLAGGDGVRSTHFVRFRRLPRAGAVRKFGVNVR